MSLDVRGVERLAQAYLARERPVRALAGDHVGALLGRPAALGLHREHVALDREVDRVGPYTGQVEQELDVVVLADGVHRHPGRPSRVPEQTVGEPVGAPEGSYRISIVHRLHPGALAPDPLLATA